MTTTTVSTIGATGDYSTIQLWIDDAPADMQAEDVIWIGELKKQEFVVTSGFNFAGHNTDDVNRFILRPESGAGFADDADAATNQLRYDATTGAAISFTAGYASLFNVFSNLTLIGLQIRATNSTGTIRLGYARVHGCILQQIANGYGPAIFYARPTSPTDNYVCSDSVIIGSGTLGVVIAKNYQFINTRFYSTNGGNAIRGDYGDSTCKNCLFLGHDTVSNGRNFFTNCATDLATFSASSTTDCLTSLTLTDQIVAGGTDVTALDLRLKSTADVIGAGINLYPDYVTDIWGNDRASAGAWDIGGYYYVGGGVDTIFSLDITSTYRQRSETSLPIPTTYKQRQLAAFSLSSVYQQRNINTLDVLSGYLQRDQNTIAIATNYLERAENALNITSAYQERLTDLLDIQSSYLAAGSDVVFTFNVQSSYLARLSAPINIQSEYREREADQIQIASQYQQRQVNGLDIASEYLQRQQSQLTIGSEYQQRLTGILTITTSYQGVPVVIPPPASLQISITEPSYSIAIRESSYQLSIKG
ncbi:hypothetical protein [Neptunicella sp.]|uniref:hypothetical protein n=1 Tax=Neptunicella sp. TaxID=2125986 RepID=UPI003F694B9A